MRQQTEEQKLYVYVLGNNPAPLRRSGHTAFLASTVKFDGSNWQEVIKNSKFYRSYYHNHSPDEFKKGSLIFNLTKYWTLVSVKDYETDVVMSGESNTEIKKTLDAKKALELLEKEKPNKELLTRFLKSISAKLSEKDYETWKNISKYVFCHEKISKVLKEQKAYQNKIVTKIIEDLPKDPATRNRLITEGTYDYAILMPDNFNCKNAIEYFEKQEANNVKWSGLPLMRFFQKTQGHNCTSLTQDALKAGGANLFPLRNFQSDIIFTLHLIAYAHLFFANFFQEDNIKNKNDNLFFFLMLLPYTLNRLTETTVNAISHTRAYYAHAEDVNNIPKALAFAFHTLFLLLNTIGALFHNNVAANSMPTPPTLKANLDKVPGTAFFNLKENHKKPYVPPCYRADQATPGIPRDL